MPNGCTAVQPTTVTDKVAYSSCYNDDMSSFHNTKPCERGQAQLDWLS